MALRHLARTTGRSLLTGWSPPVRSTRAFVPYATTRIGSQTVPTVTTSPGRIKHYSTQTPNGEPKHSPDAVTDAADIVSKGSDKTFVLERVKALTSDGGWTQTSNPPALEKTFRFNGFRMCWKFMDAVAEKCKIHKHHPKWTNVYDQVHIQWTTHSPRGLSEKDIALAKFCDKLAKSFGLVQAKVKVKENPEETTGTG